ncbi:precorrin-3B synthase [Paraburkholderia sp. GAS199]|uniref:precorrin-3B synthase n=1 Tax=Paraburkholderia sp. GAS199 TaxID=3035126 RepID=UPI003D23F43C
MNPAAPSTTRSDAALAPRPSACPGLLRIVSARDGGICRIKLAGGVLSAAQAEAVAAASEQHAAGVVEVTNRANLQIRGVREGHESALIDMLLDAQLGPLSGFTAAADDVRNVMLSPLAGRDPACLFDTRDLCADLLALLQGDARFAALSPKFALLLDGGEALARLDHPHDIWIAATPGEDGVRFVFGLAGGPPPATRRDPDSRDGTPVKATGRLGQDCAPDCNVVAAVMNPRSAALVAVLPTQVVAVVRALLHMFLDLAPVDATRMRHLLATHAPDALLQHAQRYLDFPLTHDPALATWQRATPVDATLRLGAHPQRAAGELHRWHMRQRWHVGGQPPLGRLDAAALRGLAALAHRHGDGTLHMTPWQSVLLTDVARESTGAVLDALQALGLACDAGDPLARVIACAGSAGCVKSHADTKADALRVAARLPDGVEVHLSGCSRSCAAAACAPYTLLAVSPGMYDLYRRDTSPGEASLGDTSPGDASPDFGASVARQLTIEQAAAMLEQLARSPLDA